jgi:hypothetical protein
MSPPDDTSQLPDVWHAPLKPGGIHTLKSTPAPVDPNASGCVVVQTESANGIKKDGPVAPRELGEEMAADMNKNPGFKTLGITATTRSVPCLKP